jgi:aryl-alcohol dehydrogenase-like predicted oxidoreductase
MAPTSTLLRTLGSTDLQVFPLCLGGNVFGWTADQDESFAVLDAYAAAGGNFIDTANGYSRWVEGHDGGESERVIGAWMKARANRDQMVIATKFGANGGIAPDAVRRQTEESLERLGTDRVDLMYTHHDDVDVPVEDTLRALDELVQAGKIRHVAASNLSPERLEESMQVAEREGLAPYRVLQPHYNLVEREYETTLQPVAEAHGLATCPYFGLAKGFLTGKYRPGTTIDSPRAAGAAEYLNDRGIAVLDALEEVAAELSVPPAAAALGWLAAQPTIVAPIASARNLAQLAGLLPLAELELSDEQVQKLTDAGA